jgi:single-strand DNA-binding protein
MSEIGTAILRSAQFSFIGRVGGDPEVKYFPSGTVNCKFSIAINRGRKEDNLPPDWFKIELWGDQATAAGDAIKKGDLVKVAGRVSAEEWTGRDGTKNTGKVIKAEEWSIVPTAAKSMQPQRQSAPDPLGGFDDDDDAPF